MQLEQLKGKLLTYINSGYSWIEFRLNDRATVTLSADVVYNGGYLYNLSTLNVKTYLVAQVQKSSNERLRLLLKSVHNNRNCAECHLILKSYNGKPPTIQYRIKRLPKSRRGKHNV